MIVKALSKTETKTKSHRGEEPLTFEESAFSAFEWLLTSLSHPTRPSKKSGPVLEKEKQNMIHASKVLLLSGVLLLGGCFAYSARAEENLGVPELKVFHSARTQTLSVMAFAEGFRGGVNVASGDLNGDGKEEILAAAGPGGGPNVRVFNADGSPRLNFMAYDVNFRGGVNVASCDLDADGRAEIITAPRNGGGPNVRVFNADGSPRLNFMAYDVNFRGGVNVACGDVLGDNRGEIITGSGLNGGNHVRVFDRKGKWTGIDFWPFAPTDRGGASVAAGDVDGDGRDEVLVGIQRLGPAWVKIYRAESTRPILAEFRAYPESFRGGVQLAAGDVNGDGRDEVAVGVSSDGGPSIRLFNGSGEYQRFLFPYPESFHGGVHLALGDLDEDGKDELLTGPGAERLPSADPTGKRILVDLSEQRLYAFERNQLIASFLVSTGVARMPTPTGSFAVFRKIANKLYQGPDYYLPNTPWNLNFKPSYYLHAAYWHNNFGRPMSHGCVNLSVANAKWVYDWAPLGTSVVIQH